VWHRLTRTIAPTVDPVTLAEVKAALRVDGTDEDTHIAGLIKAATARVEQGAGIALLPQTWRASLDRFPVGSIRIPLAPVSAVSSITYRAQDGTTATLDPAAYEFDLDVWPLLILPRSSGRAGRSRASSSAPSR
jgi:uncharacterized phiE125 gp8 family phage protein